MFVQRNIQIFDNRFISVIRPIHFPHENHSLPIRKKNNYHFITSDSFKQIVYQKKLPVNESSMSTPKNTYYAYEAYLFYVKQIRHLWNKKQILIFV